MLVLRYLYQGLVTGSSLVPGIITSVEYLVARNWGSITGVRC